MVNSVGRVTVAYSRAMSAAAFDPASCTIILARIINSITAAAGNTAVHLQPLVPNVDYTLNAGPITATNGQTLAMPATFPLVR